MPSDRPPDASIEVAHADALARELREVAERSNEIRARSKSANTLDAYESAWDAFAAWCAVSNLASMPADPRTVVLYLTHLEREGLGFSSIGQARAAIVFAHRKNRSPFDEKDEYLRETMEGLANTIGVAPRSQKRALDGELLQRVVAPLTQRLIEVRDRALLTVGWFGGYRRSELVALTTRDVAFTDEGVRAITRRSKGDQEGKGHEKPLPYASNPAVCPVRSLRAWMTEARIEEGAIFRSVTRHGEIRGPLGAGSVALVVKRACRRVGLDEGEFAAHSLRAGFITTAAARGKSLDAIMRQTDHKSAKIVRDYIRHVKLFEHSAAVGLL